MDIEELQAVPAITKLILIMHVASASRANQRTPALRIIDITAITAYPAFVNPNVKITVIDHMSETAFFAYHVVPPLVVSYYRTRTYIV
jgi:hypothetical protein